MFAAEWGTGEVFWSMLWFFLFVVWIWLLITVFAHIFKSHDLSGWGKALWLLVVLVLPYLGVFLYLIIRGDKLAGGTGSPGYPQSARDAAFANDARSHSYYPGSR